MLSAMLIVPALWTGIVNVNIQSFSFVPDTVRIQPGDTVRWTQKDGTSHTSSGTGTGAGDWNSGALNQNEVYTRAFPTAGVFPYICDFHSMFGTVVVGTPTALRAAPVTPPKGAIPVDGARDARGRLVNPGGSAAEGARGTPTFAPR
jgi:plastocyanin